MRLLVVSGSRSPRRELIQVCLDVLDERLECGRVPGETWWLLQGGALGIDRQARVWAEKHKIFPVSLHAPWTSMGKPAGMARNKEMIRFMDVARTALWDIETYAFPGPESVGTYGFINTAKAAGFDVMVRAL